jgi:hypothetical protein
VFGLIFIRGKEGKIPPKYSPVLKGFGGEERKGKKIKILFHL